MATERTHQEQQIHHLNNVCRVIAISFHVSETEHQLQADSAARRLEEEVTSLC